MLLNTSFSPRGEPIIETPVNTSSKARRDGAGDGGRARVSQPPDRVAATADAQRNPSGRARFLLPPLPIQPVSPTYPLSATSVRASDALAAWLMMLGFGRHICNRGHECHCEHEPIAHQPPSGPHIQ